MAPHILSKLGQKRRFFRQAQGTEFIEVQYQLLANFGIQAGGSRRVDFTGN